MDIVTIYHGYENDGRMAQHPLPDILVAKYAYETDRSSLDEIYRDNNAVDGTEQNVRNKARSLSVGDIIGFRKDIREGHSPEIFTVVDSYGFTPVSEEVFATIPQVTEEDVKARRDELNRKYREARTS